MEIGNNIKNLRKQKGLRQEQLAEAMGVSAASVSKWETNQSYPELTTLGELADFFEVSLDTLLDHRLNEDRLEALIAQMEQAVEARDEAPAAALCEKLLRNYPNHCRAVEACVDGSSTPEIYTADRGYMERCIEQTKRLMTLSQGEQEKDRLERMHALGNQYGHLNDWDKAKEYYERSNVNGSSKTAIAECLLKLGKTQEAVAMVSDEMLANIFHLFQTISILADGLLALKETEQACAALEWLSDVMASLHFNPTTMMLLQVKLAGMHIDCGDTEAAQAAIRRAAELVKEECRQELDATADFLQHATAKKMLISAPGNNREMLLQLAAGLGEPYADSVRQALG